MASSFDEAWWIALIVPYVISVAAFLFKALYKSTRHKLTLAYFVKEETSVALSSLQSVSIVCWNDGDEVIRGHDLAPKKPLQITHDNANFLSHKIKISSREENGVGCSPGPEAGSVVITFEFLNPGDGFLWVSDHDGSPGRISMAGTIMGGRSSPRRHKPLPATMFLGLSLVTVFGSIDIAGTTVEVISSKGFNSLWTLAYLPVPLFF